MISKPITFTDFNGYEQTEVHYFNISKAELAQMEIAEQVRDGQESVRGGFSERLQRIGTGGTGKEIVDTMKELIQRAWGIRSDDGRKFYKTPELFREFEASAAYDALLEEILMDPDKGLELIKGAMPSPDGDSPNRAAAGGTVTPPPPTLPTQNITVDVPPPPAAGAAATLTPEQMQQAYIQQNQRPMTQ